jgi:TonB family protein
MNDRFKRALTVSTAVHVGVILLVVVTPLLSNLLRPRRPKDITFIDMMASLPAMPVAPVDVAPQPQPQPTPPQPAPPKSEPVVKSSTAEKSKIKTSTNKVVRKDVPKQTASAPVKSTLTPEQIKKVLDSGVKFTGLPGSATGEFSDLGLYYAIVQQTMYGAWQQPGTVARGQAAEVSMRIARSGAVLQRRLSRSSGNALMDASVMRAVESVSRLKPLPPEIGGPHLDVTVEFVIGDGF